MARIVTATLLALAALALLAKAHAQPLSLDPTFGADGTVAPAPLGARGIADAVIPASPLTKGRTYVAGETGGLNGKPFVLALLEDGTPDPSFGSGGVVIVDDPALASGRFFGLALGPDGTVFAAGAALVPDGNGDGARDSQGIIAGYDLSGAPTFAGGFTLVDDPLTETNFLLFFNVTAAAGGACATGRAFEGDDLAPVACVDASGTLRADFGTGGLAFVSGPPAVRDVRASAITTDASGRLLVAGLATDTSGQLAMTARLLASGEPDPSYSGDGFVAVRPLDLLGNDLLDVISLTDGRVFAVGVGRKGPVVGALGVLFTASGELDPAFGSGGAIWVDAESGQVDTAVAAAQLADGTLRLIARANEFPRGGPPSVALIGTNLDGHLLYEVGPGGLQLLGGGDDTFSINDGGFDASGRLVVVGNETLDLGGPFPATQGALVARYASGGIGAALTPLGTTAFPAEGGTLRYEATVSNGGTSPAWVEAWTVAVLANGKTRVLVGPEAVTLDPGESVSSEYRLRVKPNVPAGTYTIELRVGSFPAETEASDSFMAVKTAPKSLTATVLPEDALTVEEAIDAPLAISPNPTAGRSWITPEASGAASEPVRVRVLDALGREAGAVSGRGGTRIALPTERLAPGAYIVVLETADGTRRTARLTVVR